MKKCFTMVLLLFLSISFFTGCGALVGIISSIFGSQSGFVFIPFLSDSKITASGAPIPGMVFLYEKPANLPGYQPLSSATVMVEGSNQVATTDENGYFVINNIEEGVKNLIVQKDGYVSRTDEIAVAATTSGNTMTSSSVSTVTSIGLLPSYGMNLITGQPAQLTAYGKTSDNHISTLTGLTWEIVEVAMQNLGGYTIIENNNNAIIDSNGVFTGNHPDPNNPRAGNMRVKIRAKYNSLTSELIYIYVNGGSITVSGNVTSKGQTVSGARVQMTNTPYFTTTDSNGHYILPNGLAYSNFVVAAQLGDENGSNTITEFIPPGGEAVLNIEISSSPVKFAYESTIGSAGFPGTANNQFNNPHDVAIDSKGNVYVSDYLNNRVQKFNSANNYVATIGETGVPGEDNNHFWGTFGVCVDKIDNVYICDGVLNRVQKYDSTGKYLKTFGIVTITPICDNKHFYSPYDVAVDNTGNMYVADGYFRVQKFDENGNYLFTIGEPTVEGSDDYHFWTDIIAYLAVDSQDNLYVSDISNHRIQIFNSSGTYLSTIGESGVPGSDNSHFFRTTGVAVEQSSGNIFISDAFNNRVQLYDGNHNYLGTVGISGFEGITNDKFKTPNGVAISPVNSKLYVVDKGNNRVQIFTRQ